MRVIEIGNAITFKYINHKGRISDRTVVVEHLHFLPDPGFGYQPGWFVTGIDVDKEEYRSFALTHIVMERDTPQQIFELMRLA